MAIVWIGKFNIASIFPFLETDIKEQKLWKQNTDICDNTVNDLLYEIKFESYVKDKNNFFIKQNIAFLF